MSFNSNSGPDLATDLTDAITEPATTDAPTSPGDLVLVGGNWQYPATEDPYGVSIYLDILERAGGIENARIGIFTTASSSQVSAYNNGQLYLEDFRDLYERYLQTQYPNLAIDVVWLPFTADNAEEQEDSQALIRNIQSCTGFIFGGGDQSLITEAFFDEDPVTGTRTETPVYQALRQRFEEGAVVAGTSAGTTVQTNAPMITEGESYEAVTGEPNVLIGSPPFVRDLYYNPLGGLGFFNYGLLDTHFSERGRQGRIIRLASEVDQPLAFGVDENTALVVTDANTPEVNLEVLGEGGVFVADLTDATIDQTDGHWSISGVNATYLTEGDDYDPLTRTASFGGKTSLSGQETSNRIPITPNVFSRKDPETGDWTDPRAFTETAIELFQSTASTGIGLTQETEPVQYGVTMSKTSESQGFIDVDSLGTERVSFTNLELTIAPLG